MYGQALQLSEEQKRVMERWEEVKAKRKAGSGGGGGDDDSLTALLTESGLKVGQSSPTCTTPHQSCPIWDSSNWLMLGYDQAYHVSVNPWRGLGQQCLPFSGLCTDYDTWPTSQGEGGLRASDSG